MECLKERNSEIVQPPQLQINILTPVTYHTKYSYVLSNMQIKSECLISHTHNTFAFFIKQMK